MNERQRFQATMHYQPRDRCPIMDFSFWDDAIPTWHAQGMPQWVDRTTSLDFFGMDGLEWYTISNMSTALMSVPNVRKMTPGRGVNVGLCPTFDETVLEDRGDHEIAQQADGVRVLRKKFMGSIPMHEGHLLVDRASWNEHYAPRLDPDHPDRLPPEFAHLARAWSTDERIFPLFVPGGSLYGWIRNWMGVENASYVVYDDPAFFEQMVETVADCIIGTLRRVLATGVQLDACSMWEDMCYNAGPLLSPAHFKQYVVPHYRRITGLLRRHGVDVIWVDCDGCIDELIPLWMEAGVNCMMPLEIGTWGADPIAYRKKFGKDLLMMGGFDKHVLARTHDEIEAEVHRLTPLVDESGYIPFCDHRVPPDVPYENYLHYLHCARRVWGKGVNLRPMHDDVSLG